LKTILLTGATGQVGWELRRQLSPSHQVIAPDRKQLDLSNPDSIRRFVRESRPDIILNPAAYTAVDKAESETDLSMRINGFAPGILAEEARQLDALLIHYSTDYVFDGENTAPYREDTPPNPQSAYGRTKLTGELAVQSAGCRHLILRTSWVYGIHGGNFIKTVLRLARERGELRIVADQFGAPTWAHLLASSTLQILNSPQTIAWDSHLSGIYHLTAGGRTSWYEYAEEILKLARRHDTQLKHKTVSVHPISTEEYPLPAKRPKNSVLSTAKIRQTFGLSLPEWQDDLATCLNQNFPY
jgi:dTDP-4-dehydrorhamnose reductase